MSVSEQIADAVITHLAGESFSYPIAVSKKLVPIYDRDKLEPGWEVTVHVGPQVRVRQARSGISLKTYQVGIVIRFQPLANEADNQAAGKILQLAEEIMDSLESFLVLGKSKPDEIEQSDPFSLSKQEEMGYYITQIFARYKGF